MSARKVGILGRAQTHLVKNGTAASSTVQKRICSFMVSLVFFVV
jgi:hypothetical protein